MIRTIISVLFAFCMLIPAASAQDSAAVTYDTTYVSFKGKFFIHFPSRWIKIDYNTIEYYQRQSGNVMSYEAVFAPPTSNPFFANDYSVLQVDTLAGMTDQFVDTLLEELSLELRIKIRRVARITDLAAEVSQPGGVYDEFERVVWYQSEIVDRADVRKKALTAELFYTRGIARFLFYIPENDYATLLPQAWAMVSSFGDEDYQAKLTTTPLQLADTTAFPEEKTTSRTWMIAMAGAAVAIITALLVARKKK